MSDAPLWEKYGQKTYLSWRRSIKPYLVEPEKKQYTILGISLFSVAIFGWFAIRPAILTTVDIINQINQYERILNQLNKKIVDISLAREDYLNKKQFLKAIEEAIPTSRATSRLLLTLEELVAESGCQISSLSFESEKIYKEYKGVYEIGVVVTAKGDKESLLNLVKNIEKNSRSIKIEDFSITLEKEASRSKEGAVAKSHIKIYYYQ